MKKCLVSLGGECDGNEHCLSGNFCDNTCQACHESCFTCFSDAYDTCLSCDPVSDLFLTQNNTCEKKVANCIEYNSVDEKCMLCKPGYALGDGSACTKCSVI